MDDLAERPSAVETTDELHLPNVRTNLGPFKISDSH